MASVLLVFQMGQPRIWMSMSRDGLLPKKFSTVHPKFKTPSFATIVVGFVVAVPALFMNLTMVTDLCSIGTLFAFVLVCAGVLALQNRTDIPRGKFKTPYVNSKYIFPLLIVIALVFSFGYNKKATMGFITNETKINDSEFIITSLNKEETQKVYDYLVSIEGKTNATEKLDVEHLLSQYQEDDAKYAMLLRDCLFRILLNMKVDLICSNTKYRCGFS